MKINLNEKINITGSKVLVVEHNDRNYYSIERMLAHNGLRLLRVQTGKEAIRMSTKYVDIVFINTDIPFVDVFNTAKEIKVAQPDLPVIAHSSLISDEEKKKYLDAGCDSYMFKPLQKESLLNEITRCLLKQNKNPEYFNQMVINKN